MDKERNRDLEDVRKEETRRGRRPLDVDAKRERDKLLRDLGTLLRLGTETEFVAAMRAVGLQEGSAELEQALRIWREFRP
jgi:hypothetical protein